MLIFELFKLSLVIFSCEVGLDFVGEVLIEVFGHLEFLFDYLKLIFERLIETFVFDILAFKVTVAVAACV